MKNYLKKIKNIKKGFTLIEMIVVIAIIGVLAAILVPSLSGYVTDAKTAKGKANARTFYTAAQAAVTSFETTTTPVGKGTYPKSGSGVNTALNAKISELLGASNYDKISTFTIEVDEKGAVTSVTVTETGSEAVTYPEATPTV